jgi:hypothetical protein
VPFDVRDRGMRVLGPVRRQLLDRAVRERGEILGRSIVEF